MDLLPLVVGTIKGEEGEEEKEEESIFEVEVSRIDDETKYSPLLPFREFSS